jgi:small subunit ribosomal protein S8
MNYILSDMFTRLRNGQKAKKFSILTPQSKLSSQLLDIFYKEGFISGYKISLENSKMFEIILKYYKGKPVINKVVSISKPSKRIYMSVNDLWKLNTGLNLIVLSTSKGILSDKVCRQLNVGGEVFCTLR